MRAAGPSPLRYLAGSFLILIGAGAALLLLPAATPPESPIGVIDAVFTATSAACVTGLIVRDTGSEFTAFGQAVILVLIQLGGIGIMTFSLLVYSLFASRLSMVSRFLVSHTLAGAGEWEDFWPLLKTVAGFTLLTEMAGAALLFLRWQPLYGTARGAYTAVFHSISAFCNAGFSLWPNSLEAFRDDLYTNVVVCVLIVLGGLGFLVVLDLLQARRRRRVLSLHTRLALWTSSALILAGGALFWTFERSDALAGLGPKSQVLTSLFQSITCRTAGFNTVSIGALAPGTLFLMVALMFIGGSPGSCAGGIKTTTFAVLVLTAWHRLGNRKHISAFRRKFGATTLANTLSITMAGIFVVIAALLVLLFLEAPNATADNRHGTFIAYLFEVVSALGTVGLSCGVTTMLSPASRLLISVLMFLGRLGPLTVAASFARENPVDDWQYPEEDVMVG